MDSKDELLIILLKCGYMDVDKLIEVMEFGEELFDENLLYDIIDEYGSEAIGDFNAIMYRLMDEIVLRLVSELDEEVENDKDSYIYILDEYWSHPYVNYLDSHFQLECLDGRTTSDKYELLEELRKELIEMKNRIR